MSEFNASNGSQQQSGQLYFVQWLRVVLISLVVAHHAGQPYGPTGGEWPIDDPASSNLLGIFFLFNSALGMGFFFFIAGYFVSGSYDRKGGAVFVRDRILRLGVPMVIVSLFLFGPIAFLSSGSQTGFVDFMISEYIGQWKIELGPLWFVAQLLAYSIIYAVWRETMPGQKTSEPQIYSIPGNRTIFAYVVILGIAGMIVRSFYQQDVWIKILGVIPAEVVHLPQYWSLFTIGIIAGRGKWLVTLPSSLGPKWLTIGIAAFGIALLTQSSSQVLPDALTLNAWQWNILWGLLEAFVCVGFILGVTVFFRDRFSSRNMWIGRLDQNVFGVYVFHVFILVGLQGAILEISLPALAKFAIVAIAGVILSFLNSSLLRLIPGVKRVI